MSTPGMPESVAKRLGYALKRAQHALRIAMDDALRSIDLTMPQYAVMCAIEAEAGLSNARLARAAFITPQTMQGILANMQRDGVLARSADPNNARILRTELTPRGRQRLAKAHKAVGTVEELMVTSFGRGDADRIARALTACADDLTAARGPRDRRA